MIQVICVMDDVIKATPWTRAVSSIFFLGHIGHPLSPVASDVNFIKKHIKYYVETKNKKIRVLILGVTPEYFYLDLPKTILIKIVYQTQEMIDFVWPGFKSDVFHLNWLHIESNDIC